MGNPGVPRNWRTRCTWPAWFAVLLLPAVLSPSLAQTRDRPVLFALQRSERLHAFDAETLKHLGHFVTGPLGDALAARLDGRRLFLLQQSSNNPLSCCSLRALELATREMCWMTDFAAGEITIAGGLVAAGQSVFDAQTLARVPIPRGFFSAFVARPSADGRHTASIDRGPVLAFTNTASRTRRELPIPEAARPGDWVGDRYLLIAAGQGTGRLWSVSPADTALPEPRALILPDADPRFHKTFAVGSDLVSYERFGGHMMIDRRRERAVFLEPVPGGALVIPSVGGKARRIAKNIYFTSLVAGQDGPSLYAVEAGPPEGPAKPVRLLRLDVQTGKVTMSVVLNDAALFPDAAFDVWSLAFASVPENLIPRGEVHLSACRAR